jgi:hypothetical protein
MIKDDFHCCKNVFSFSLGFKVSCALHFLGFSFHHQSTMNVNIGNKFMNGVTKDGEGFFKICN